MAKQDQYGFSMIVHNAILIPSYACPNYLEYETLAQVRIYCEGKTYQGHFLGENVVSKLGRKVSQEIGATHIAMDVQVHITSHFLPLSYHIILEVPPS